jgi:hypothetical protein
LHKPIPQVDTDGPNIVQYLLSGTPEQYRRKVYGKDWDGVVSPEDLMEEHYAWDLRRAYDWLWKSFEPWIIDTDLVPERNWHYKRILAKHDLVISTVPRKIWWVPGDLFESIKIWALGDTELPRVEKPYRPAPFTVQCDGNKHVPWYRVSNIYGYCTMEWPHYISNPGTNIGRPLYPGASLVEKPLKCYSRGAPDFIHLGRYGAWEKGILTSDVFFQAMKVLADDKIG